MVAQPATTRPHRPLYVWKYAISAQRPVVAPDGTAWGGILAVVIAHDEQEAAQIVRDDADAHGSTASWLDVVRPERIPLGAPRFVGWFCL